MEADLHGSGVDVRGPRAFPYGPVAQAEHVGKGETHVGVLAEMVAIAPQLDWWHTYRAILRWTRLEWGVNMG